MKQCVSSSHARLCLVASLALVSGCDRTKAGIEREAQHQQEADRAAGQTVTKAPQTWAASPSASVLSADTLRSDQGHVHHFRLALPKDWSAPTRGTLGFDKAQLERFVVLLPSGNQESVGDLGTRNGDEIVYSYPETGTMVSSMCTYADKGSGQEKLYCLKRIYTVGQHRGDDAMPSTTARLGDFAEIRPLVAPEQLLPGSDFPVMAYLGGARATNVQVHAFTPEGKVITVKTGHAGVADIPIHRFGAWKIRVVGEVKGTQMVAELEFRNDQQGAS